MMGSSHLRAGACWEPGNKCLQEWSIVKCHEQLQNYSHATSSLILGRTVSMELMYEQTQANAKGVCVYIKGKHFKMFCSHFSETLELLVWAC